ncbi:MAG TPA: tetratricopeptide repeat protein [Thermoanaerobaculia bacterium]|nr:tetratricopeptide repeat protein [Thermoanaerobaculia bacterium]
MSHVDPWMRSLGVLILIGALLVVGAGCATVSEQGDRADLARAFRTKGLDPAAVVIPHELTEEMKAWAHQQVPRGTPDEKRLSMLLMALLGPQQLHLEYQGNYTATAEEVFRTRRANCLSFTSLFVGMAREVGVDAFFLDVNEIESFEKEGDLVVVSGHVSAGYGLGRELKILDFAAAPAPQSGYKRRVQPISDLTAISLFHSNRGAEALRAGQEKEALEWLRKAVLIDPELSRAWVNYGVALRRTGDVEGAETAYRKALEVDPGAVSAYQNLAALLEYRGKRKEAGELLALTDKNGNRNPYSYLALGDWNLANGRVDEARRFYKRALRLYKGNAEPYAALGIVSLLSGDRSEAEKWLRKAAAIDQENGRVQQLSRRLGTGMSAG